MEKCSHLEYNSPAIYSTHARFFGDGLETGIKPPRQYFTRQLVFKELKSLYQLDVISSGATAVVESLVLVVMLTLVVSHRLLNHMRLLAPEKSARFTPLRWAESFYAVAPIMMGRVLKAASIDEDPFSCS